MSQPAQREGSAAVAALVAALGQLDDSDPAFTGGRGLLTPVQLGQRRRGIITELIRALLTLFTGLGSWRDPDRDRFIGQAVPLVRGGQRATADLAAAYIAQRASAHVGRVIRPPIVGDDHAVNLRSGVDDHDVYGRPFLELYTALSEDRPFPEALQLAEQRLDVIADLDMQQGYAEATREALNQLEGDAAPVGWRRVLVGEWNCALCAIAATQRYHKQDLNAIHPGCDCTVEPLYDDVGQVIDPDLLERTHDAVEELVGTVDRGARDPDYRKILVRDHGELGPMLAKPLDRFTGPGDVPDSTGPRDRDTGRGREPDGPGGPVNYDSARQRIRAATAAPDIGATLARALAERDVTVTGFTPQMHVDTAREYATAMLDMIEAHPAVQLRLISTEDLGPGVYAVTDSVPGRWSEIKLNTRFAGDRDHLLAALARDQLAGFHPPNMSTAYGVLVHEFGHVLDTGHTADQLHGELRGIVGAVADTHGVRLAGSGGSQWMRQQIPGYGFDRNGFVEPAEMIAEAFADVVINGQAATDVSRAVYDRLVDLVQRR